MANEVFRVYHVTLRAKRRKNEPSVKQEFSGLGCDERAISSRVATFQPWFRVVACEEITERVALCEECWNPKAPAEPHPATRILITVDRHGRFGATRWCNHHNGLPDDLGSVLVRTIETGEASYGEMAQQERATLKTIESERFRSSEKGDV